MGKPHLFDDESQMAPESEVATWWNALSSEKKLEEAQRCYPDIWDTWEWDRNWCELLPVGQQMHLHMQYDAARVGTVGRSES